MLSITKQALRVAIALLFLCLAAWGEECSYCHRQASLQAHRDGRRFCGGCIAQNVFDETKSAALQYECMAFLTKTLGPGFPVPPFKLCDEPEFTARREKLRLGPSIEGIYSYSDRTVYFRSGLRPANFQGLLVHECTHAWAHQVCPRQDRGLQEGFASLLQYHWLVSKGESRIAKAIMNDPDPNYGAALTALLAKEKQIGLPALIDKVQKSRKLTEVLAP